MKKKIGDLRVAELRSELERRGLDSKGLKGALVQRLQKAVEDEDVDPNEFEIANADPVTPKTTGRRSVGRAKRTQESESEDTQDTPVKETVVGTPETEINTEEVKDEVAEGESEDLREQENGMSEKEQGSASDIQAESTQCDEEPHSIEGDHTEVGRDVTPTRDEEEDGGSAEQYYDEEYDPPINEDESEAYEDVGEYEEDAPHDDYEEEAGNDFQHDDAGEYQVEEEMEEECGGEQGGDEGEMVTVEEMAEHEESGAGDAVVEEEDFQETGEVEREPEVDSSESQHHEDDSNTGEVSDKSQHESAVTEMDTEKVDSDATGVEKTSDEKPETQAKGEQGGKDEVVSSEVDVLDMLDYDLELTGDQNNINAQGDDQSMKNKTSKCGATAAEEPFNSSDDHNAQSKPGSSKPSSLEPARADSQSSSKSASSTSGKDAGKTASNKRDVSKEENANRNLWISGLSSTTRASELKGAFSRYGKVVGAKVVTNVKSPGSKCFGYVTMATADAASKCILHLNNTDMHGRMITVEIAKGDPSASSRKSTSSSGTSRKDADNKDFSKSKDADSGSSSRRQSLAQSSKDDGIKDGADSSKKSQDGKPGTVGRGRDGERQSGGKSPIRSRTERGSMSGGPRAGDKRHSNRSPPHNRSASTRNEPDRKRSRPNDAADRKVVMDSNKGELRVNVSRTSGRASGGARWESDQKPKPLLSRRRSMSPVRRRSFSPLRSNRGGRGRGRGGLVRSSGTYADRTVTRPGPRRDGRPVLTMNQIRAQHRDRGRLSDRGGRIGMSRGDLSADRERLRRERDERERLRIERERLERERRQLEKDRQERERLEAERIRLEQERKRELERIEREKAEMRRLQEITRYEVEQRQRAIKRTYDDDLGHRGSRGSRDAIPVKRSGDRGARPEIRRERDDNRRGYNSFNSRNSGPRNGPSSEPSPPGTTDYRSRQGSFRESGNTSKQYESRGRPQERDDSRYTSGSRTVDKYDRRSGADTGGRLDYQSPNYERVSSDAHRRGAPARDGRDGRKVVRERPNERGESPEYRRQSSGRAPATARIELTREQSPPTRRIRRDASPAPASSRSATWREGGKTSRDSTRRTDDRDLREQLRGSRQDNYSDSNRTQRRASRSPNRSTSQYSSTRWPDNSSGNSSSQTYSVTGDGSAIPTTGRGSGSANWSQQWPQNAWSGAAMQTASAVNRQVIPPYGTVPSPSTIITPGSNLIPAAQGYVASNSDRQSRSFQGSSYNKQPIQRRF